MRLKKYRDQIFNYGRLLYIKNSNIIFCKFYVFIGDIDV